MPGPSKVRPGRGLWIQVKRNARSWVKTEMCARESAVSNRSFETAAIRRHAEGFSIARFKQEFMTTLSLDGCPQ